MIELRIEVRRPDEDRWYYATGEGLAETLATLYAILRDDEPTFAPYLLLELETAEVAWCGELHPLPAVLRFQAEAARMAAERVQELRTGGASPAETIQTVEGETKERRLEAMRAVQRREAVVGPWKTGAGGGP